MANIPAQINLDGRITSLAVIACPSSEIEFRDENLADDRRLAMFCVVVTILGALLFIPNDFRLFSSATQFFILLAVRITSSACFLWIWFALRGTNSPRHLDLLMLFCCLLTAAGNLYVCSTRPPAYLGHAIVSVGMVMVAYCVIPLPLTLQIVVAVPFSVAAVAQAFRGPDGLTATAVGMTYLMANVLGMTTSWQANRRRRVAFLAARREAVLRGELEQALAEVKTLRGLLRICAWCKRIHDRDAWQPIEAYVRSHTHAEFTHGICPACFAEQLPKQ